MAHHNHGAQMGQRGSREGGPCPVPREWVVTPIFSACWTDPNQRMLSTHLCWGWEKGRRDREGMHGLWFLFSIPSLCSMGLSLTSFWPWSKAKWGNSFVEGTRYSKTWLKAGYKGSACGWGTSFPLPEWLTGAATAGVESDLGKWDAFKSGENYS